MPKILKYDMFNHNISACTTIDTISMDKTLTILIIFFRFENVNNKSIDFIEMKGSMMAFEQNFADE